MPITVSCPACAARFSLSEDLYRRRILGSLIKVKCRNCSAQIALDATELTMPTEDTPRKHPHPPRRGVTQLGLGTPPAPAELTATSPPELDPTSSPLPFYASITPLPSDTAATKPLPPVDADMSWNDEPTLALSTAQLNPPPRPPRTPAEPSAVGTEPEQIEAEELPASSSNVPTLDALTVEAGGAHVPHGKPARDEFLVNLSADSDGILGTDSGTLGAPTIDVTGFAAEIGSRTVDVPLQNEEPEREYHGPRPGTVPALDLRFDTDAAPPVDETSESTGRYPAAATALEPSKTASEAQLPEGRTRERKFVIAPQVEEVEAEAPKRRSSAVAWVGVLTAVAAVVAVVSLRGLHWTQPISTEPGALPVQPIVNNQAALPAEEPALVPAAEASEPATAASTTASAPLAQNVAPSTLRPGTPSSAPLVKSSSGTTSAETAMPSSAAGPAGEKSDVAGKPIEAHNAPPAAAPDTEFDRDAARDALASAATQASSCRKEGDPSGTANLTVTFAPSGRVTSAQVQGPPFSGTPTGGCIASTMRRASVPAFSGDFVTVSRTIVVQ